MFLEVVVLSVQKRLRTLFDFTRMCCVDVFCDQVANPFRVLGLLEQMTGQLDRRREEPV